MIEVMAKLSCLLRRQWLSLILGGILAVLMFSLLGGTMGPRDLANLRRHRRDLEARRDRLQAEENQMNSQIDRLKNDNAYVERQIRNELGYTRQNELIYRFPDQPAAKNP